MNIFIPRKSWCSSCVFRSGLVARVSVRLLVRVVACTCTALHDWCIYGLYYLLSRFQCSLTTGMVGLALKWVRLAPNGTNPGLFQIRFQCIWHPRVKCTEI